MDGIYYSTWDLTRVITSEWVNGYVMNYLYLYEYYNDRTVEMENFCDERRIDEQINVGEILVDSYESRIRSTFLMLSSPSN